MRRRRLMISGFGWGNKTSSAFPLSLNNERKWVRHVRGPVYCDGVAMAPFRVIF
jgi:hypothetical protein